MHKLSGDESIKHSRDFLMPAPLHVPIWSFILRAVLFYVVVTLTGMSMAMEFKPVIIFINCA